MKQFKKISAAILVLAMILTVLPFYAIAAGGDYTTELKIEKTGDTTVDVKWMLQTSNGAIIKTVSSILFKYDNTVFDLVANDGTVITTKTMSDNLLDTVVDGEGNQKVTTIISPSMWNGSGIYTEAKDSYTFVLINLASTSNVKTMECTTKTALAVVHLKLKSGTVADGLPNGSIALPSKTEAYGCAQSGIVIYIGAGEEIFIYCKTTSGGDTLSVAPVITAGTGVTFAKLALAGSVSISGTAKIDTELTAVTSGITSTETGALSYKWYRGDTAIDGATANAYTPSTADDVNQTIKVEVSAANYSGSLTSEATAAVAMADGPAAPTAPTADKTHNTITVSSQNAAYEYACVAKDAALVDTDWKTSGSFTGLTANTAYDVYARVAATATQNASAASVNLGITTSKTPAGTAVAPVIASQTDTTVNVNAVAGQKYMIKLASLPAPTAGESGWNTTVVFGDLKRNTDYVVYSYIPETTSTEASAVVSTPVTTNKTTITDTLVPVSNLTGQIYGGANLTLEPTFGGLLIRDTAYTVAYAVKADSTGSFTAEKPVGAGTYTVTITGIGDYTGSFQKEFTINPKDVTITPNSGQTKTYGDPDPTLSYGYGSGLSGAHSADFHNVSSGALSRTEGENVGTYLINMGTLSGGDNYRLTLASDPVYFSITQKDVTETRAASAQNVVKGVGDFTEPSFGNVTGALTYSYDGATTYSAIKTKLAALAKDATATITWSYAANGNYTGTITGSINFTVVDVAFTVGGSPATAENTLTVKAAPVYGDAWADIVKLKSGITLTAAVNGQTDTDQNHFTLSVTGKPSAGDAQEYKLLYNGTINGVTYTNVVVCSGTVDVAPITLTAANLEYTDAAITKPYDTTTTCVLTAISVKSGVLVNGDTLTINGTAVYDSATATATKVTFTPTAITSGNYRLAATETVDIPATITKINPTYAAPTNLTATFGQTLNDVAIASGNGTGTGVWSWDTAKNALTTSVGGVATNSFKAIFTPTDATNYNTISDVSVNVVVSKAAARTLSNITGSQKYTVTTEQSKAIGNGGMPANAGTLSYTKGSAAVTGTATVSSWSVDGSGNVKYTITGGAKDAVITLPITITSQNYADSVVNVVITLLDRDAPTVSADNITVTYTGSPVPASAITGTATFGSSTVDGTWSWEGTPDITSVTNSGIKTVVFTPTDAINYKPVNTTLSLSIKQAIPAGKPSYTAINSSGLTLADANLAIGSITPTSGTIAWDLGDSTTVTVNTAYTWTYTPMDADNYKVLTGSITPYYVAPPIGAISYKLSFETNGGSKLDAVTKDSGDTVELAAYKPTRDGYTFAGWYSDVELTQLITTVKLSADTTVYAKWLKTIAFTDVEEEAFYAAAVEWAVESGITEGTSETTFSPEAVCTRAQAVTFLWRAMGSQEPTLSSCSFTDVKEGAFYYKAMLWAVEKGITNGTSATTFSPEDTVTRAQVVTMLWRAAGKPTLTGDSLFTDVDADSYYERAVLWAVEESITNGTSGTTFSPDDDCVRAQIVTFLYRDLYE